MGDFFVLRAVNLWPTLFSKLHHSLINKKLHTTILSRPPVNIQLTKAK